MYNKLVAQGGGLPYIISSNEMVKVTVSSNHNIAWRSLPLVYFHRLFMGNSTFIALSFDPA